MMNNDQDQQSISQEDFEFESLLRGLAPRQAFVDPEALVAVASQSESDAQPSLANPVASSSGAKGSVRWIATLLAAWSLGTAAGISGTLLCLQYVKTPTHPQPLHAPRSTGELMADQSTSEQSTQQSTLAAHKEDLVENVLETSDLHIGVISTSNRMYALQRHRRESTAGYSTGGGSVLTPSGVLSEIAWGRPVMSTGARIPSSAQAKQLKSPGITKPTKVPVRQPPNQRILLHNLLGPHPAT